MGEKKARSGFVAVRADRKSKKVIATSDPFTSWDAAAVEVGRLADEDMRQRPRLYGASHYYVAGAADTATQLAPPQPGAAASPAPGASPIAEDLDQLMARRKAIGEQLDGLMREMRAANEKIAAAQGGVSSRPMGSTETVPPAETRTTEE